MSLWSKGVDRSLTDQPRFEEDKSAIIKEYLGGQSGIRRIEITDCKKGVVNIDGDVEIWHRDLVDDELPFKIGELTGDLTLVGSGTYKKSVLPDVLGGNIIIQFETKNQQR